MNSTILIVEDNPDNQVLLIWTLEDAGYETICVDTAEKALDLLERNDFDLVLMDISLPSMDGKEATRRLRDNPRHAALPVIAVTAHAVSGEAQSIRDSGVDAILTKPITGRILVEAVESFLCVGANRE